MTCSMLSAIIAAAAQKKYLRNTGWRSAANDWGEAAVTLGYYKSREGRRRRRGHRRRRLAPSRGGARFSQQADADRLPGVARARLAGAFRRHGALDGALDRLPHRSARHLCPDGLRLRDALARRGRGIPRTQGIQAPVPDAV